MMSCKFTVIIFGLCLSCCLSRRYIYVNQLLTWDDAQQNCREHYTDLATFDSMDDIKTLKRPAGFGLAWIGLKDDPQTWKHMGNASTSWRWSSTGKTSQYGFETWNYLEPNNYFGEACVGMYNRKWTDTECQYLQPFVCSNVTSENTTYAYVSKYMTWSDAQAYCRLLYTDLATIESSQVNDKVADAIPWYVKTWIGLYRIPFAWSDGSQSTFRNWIAGVPDNLAYIQFCALETDLHLWDDRECDLKTGFICYAPDLVVSRTTGLRMNLYTVTDLTEQSMVLQIYMQLLEILGQNRTDVKLQLKIEPKKLETKTSSQPQCILYF